MKVLKEITLWIFLFSTFKIAKFSVCIRMCRENEQRALESLKKLVYDPSDVPSSWNVRKDCCEWKGVVCHNLTRHVIELHLSGQWINNLTWLPSLSNLEHLEMHYMDLSEATNWLQVINMLPSLLHLRLSDCYLHHIPPLLHHNFSSLETLDLSRNNFSSSIPKWVFNLSNLVSLDLSFSNFVGPFPEGPVNLTSLTTFKASGNSFNSLLPGWLFDLNSLEHLDLSYSGFKGALPSNTGNVTKLKVLRLSTNYLSSTIPSWLYRCKYLESLILMENHLEGVVSGLVSNLSSITHIDLSENILSGKLPSEIGKLLKLEELDLSRNLFVGEVSELFNGISNCLPESLGNCSSLRKLSLGYNKLTGPFPKGLGHHFPMLEMLVLSSNMFEGVVTESHFINLTQLRYFVASGNNLTLTVSQDWVPPFQAIDINMHGWNIGPQFPMWLQAQKQISYVDISNGGIEGEIPTWFWNVSSQMRLFNLSHNRFVGEVPIIKHGGPVALLLGSNNFTGPLPQISTSVSHLDLSNNYFSGGLSRFLCEAKNESYNLEILNLGKNYLSEEIPDCLMNWPKLKVLILKENNLIGGLPRSLELLVDLKFVDFRSNSLTGSLPLSLGNCSNLRKIDLADNEFVGQLPPWLGLKLSKLIILSLRSNKFHGDLPPELCHLRELQILDLANN